MRRFKSCPPHQLRFTSDAKAYKLNTKLNIMKEKLKQRKWKLILLAIIFLIVILSLLFFTGYKIKVTTSIYLACESCNSDLSNITDCRANIENKKTNPDVIKAAETFKVDLDNITKIVKTIHYPSGEITCTYYS